MNFHFAHNNFNVLDLDKSLKFYEEALGFKAVRKFNGYFPQGFRRLAGRQERIG